MMDDYQALGLDGEGAFQGEGMKGQEDPGALRDQGLLHRPVGPASVDHRIVRKNMESG